MPEISPERSNLTLDALKAERDALKRAYDDFARAGLSLDMTRGKPCSEQLDLSLDLLTILTRDDYRSAAGVDARNYGVLDGLPEAKTLFAAFLQVSPSEVIVGGNSSLQLMYETMSSALYHGVPGGGGAWNARGPAKFLCPAPGYDRHFALCEHLGIEMIPVAMHNDGPDMDEVERLAASDDQIKGIWLVPKHGNPTGTTLSSPVVQRLAKLKAAPDFRIFWDNAYAVHHLTDDPPALDDVLASCKAAGNPDRPILFGSTSKISFAGAGVAVMGGSEANMDWMREHLSKMTIGSDKLNQLRHVRFFQNLAGIEAHMKKHAAILRPKFETVDRILGEQLGGLAIASWNEPTGGYFINFDTLEGCASRVVSLAKAAGVKLTAAGATFPYGKDPRDSNIRLAPTLPPLSELEQAMNVFAVCVKLATLEKLD